VSGDRDASSRGGERPERGEADLEEIARRIRDGTYLTDEKLSRAIARALEEMAEELEEAEEPAEEERRTGGGS
jgi:hypothetical protein